MGWRADFESRAEPRQKDESGNTRVAPKGATPVFPSFPVFIVPQLDPLLVFDGLSVFRLRGPKIQAMPGSALLRFSYKIISHAKFGQYYFATETLFQLLIKIGQLVVINFNKLKNNIINANEAVIIKV